VTLKTVAIMSEKEMEETYFDGNRRKRNKHIKKF
jgi:hypothetical protein